MITPIKLNKSVSNINEYKVKYKSKQKNPYVSILKLTKHDNILTCSDPYANPPIIRKIYQPI